MIKLLECALLILIIMGFILLLVVENYGSKSVEEIIKEIKIKLN